MIRFFHTYPSLNMGCMDTKMIHIAIELYACLFKRVPL